jgi:hypothetical protein
MIFSENRHPHFRIMLYADANECWLGERWSETAL